jgi:hypothetical protein
VKAVNNKQLCAQLLSCLSQEELKINTEHLSPLIVKKIKCGIQFYPVDFSIKNYLLCADFC